MEESHLSSGMTLYLDRIPDRYWNGMLDQIEQGACSHWATVRASSHGDRSDPHSRVLWLTRKDAPCLGTYLVMALSLADGFRAAAEGRARLRSGTAWNVVRDMHDGKLSFFPEQDVDALVQTYSLGAVRHRARKRKENCLLPFPSGGRDGKAPADWLPAGADSLPYDAVLPMV